MRARETPYAVKRAATGLGLFATKPIPKGTKIIEYVGSRISNEEVEKSSGKYFFGLNKQWSIDGSGRENIARYANHSCKPNADAIITRGRIWICSNRNIKAGEEITYHYGKEYFEGIIKDIGCKCPSCQPRSHKNLSQRASNKKRTAKQESHTAPSYRLKTNSKRSLNEKVICSWGNNPRGRVHATRDAWEPSP